MSRSGGGPWSRGGQEGSPPPMATVPDVYTRDQARRSFGLGEPGSSPSHQAALSPTPASSSKSSARVWLGSNQTKQNPGPGAPCSRPSNQVGSPDRVNPSGGGALQQLCRQCCQRRVPAEPSAPPASLREEVVWRSRAEVVHDHSWVELWETRPFTDAVVICSGIRTEVHRVVLAARSPLLKAMLEKHGSGEGIEIAVAHPDPNVVKAMVKFMYTSDIDANVDCSQLLLLAAQYQVQGLMEVCAEVILEEMSVENAAVSVSSLRQCRRNRRVADVYEQALDRIHREKSKGMLRAIAEHVNL